MKICRYISLLAFLVIAACNNDYVDRADVDGRTEIPFSIDGTLDFLRDNGTVITSIEIEIADTDSARARGLMQRSSIPPQTGMLFVFDREEMQGFWMANTPVALDIMFADSEGRIVNIERYTRPFSQENVPSREPAIYVVEVPAGFADRHGIMEGDRIAWDRHDDPSPALSESGA